MSSNLSSPVSTVSQLGTSLARSQPITQFNSSDPHYKSKINPSQREPRTMNPFLIGAGPGMFMGVFLNLGIIHTALYFLDALYKDKIKPAGGNKKTYLEKESDEFGPFKALTQYALERSFWSFVVYPYGISNELDPDKYSKWMKEYQKPSTSPTSPSLSQQQFTSTIIA